MSEVRVNESWHRGDWMQTFTGKKFYPLSPDPDQVDELDIAHALSMLCRYNGHVNRFYSVAEHCVLMARYFITAQEDRELAQIALLHDATEAYVGDMVRPLKHSGEMEAYKEIEDLVWGAICEAVGIKPTERQMKRVKDADFMILLTERDALMGHDDDWSQDSNHYPLPVWIEGWSPERAEQEYLEMLRTVGLLL